MYKYAGKYDGKHQYKAILKALMISNNKGLTENSPTAVNTLGHIKNPIEMKSLNQFSELMNVKK